MPNYEEQYCNLILDVLENGVLNQTRNGKTKSVFGRSFVIDELERGEFPLLNGRKLFYKPVLGELTAFFQGPKHKEDFKKYGCNYWDEFADAEGNLKLDYGNTWLDFNGANQLLEVVKSLKYDPYGRRHIITGWNPANLATLSLPCCHILYQWYINSEKNTLEMIWYQRSVDTMLGLPADVILASTWNIILADTIGILPGKITFMLGDTHIYEDHLEATDLYLDQAVASYHTLSQVKYSYYNFLTPDDMGSHLTLFYSFKPEVIEIENYNPSPAIKFNLKV